MERKSFVFGRMTRGTVVMVLLALLCLSGGCAKLKNINELMTLKRLSEEKDAIDVDVEERKARFVVMLNDVTKEGFGVGLTSKALLAEYGPPVYVRPDDQGADLEEWMYRHPTEYFNTPKVVFYFTSDGTLMNWEFRPADESQGEAP